MVEGIEHRFFAAGGKIKSENDVEEIGQKTS